MNTDPKEVVADWLTSCYTRFENMYNADLDKNGLPAIKKAIANYKANGYFSVGEVQYLFNRTHPDGGVPKYNKHKGYDKKYGSMLRCPIKELVDSNMVNWRSGSNGVIQQPFANAIANETNWQWRMGNLRPKNNTTFGDLFG